MVILSCRPLFLFFIFFLPAISASAQFKNGKYDQHSFLLGLLNEYMGYQRTFVEGGFYYQKVDILHKSELNLAVFLDSLFSPLYPDITIANNGAPMGIKLYSPALAVKIDEYYQYKPDFRRTHRGDTLFTGKLRAEKLETRRQKLSLLLGAYVRFAADEKRKDIIVQSLMRDNLVTPEVFADGFYILSMPNAPAKAEICTNFLKNLDCESVQYVVRKGYIPGGHYIIFRPGQNLKELITDGDQLRKHIAAIKTDRAK
ncbi:hypothetical protein GCM10023091_22110 [Ravibacter arvi]|uniref:Uncharacterized protein n=1 Tax=Ravibacter arvi TaxID=2051041 RepID=A0ABP8LZG2_9BACT